MTLARMGFTLCLLASCGDSQVFAGADTQQATPSSRIEGTAIVNSTARGPVLLFLYSASQPPPPAGTGRPVSFTVLSPDAVFGNAAAGDPGPFAAPFAFSLVAPGSYLVKGFVDANDDFVPQYSVVDEMNTGDVGGAAVDPSTLAPRVVVVDTDASGAPQPVTGLPVTFSDAYEMTVDRPVFEVANLIGTTAMTAILMTVSIDDGLVLEPSPVFLTSLVDANGDGLPDDSDGDGVPDFWPKVAVRKISDSSDLADQAIALQAGFDFSSFKADLLDASGKVKPTPTPRGQLSLVIQPRAYDVTDPANPVALAAVPSGRYSITVIQSTGQTWRVPNELSPSLAADWGFTALGSQGFAVVVP